MKKKLLMLFISILAITSCITLASAENSTNDLIANENNIGEDESKRIGEKVKSEEDGFSNIAFSDGYNGFCINLAQKEAYAGQEFEVKNTSAAVNNRNGEKIGNYLKILVVDYYDYTIENPRLAQDIIWKFSDNYNECNHTIVKGIIELAESGRIIPDHGEEKIINETTKVKFDFEVLDSVNWATQNFFGYKLTYSNIINEGILGNPSEDNGDTNESEIPENNTTQNETIPQNNTTTENKQNETSEDNSSLISIPMDNSTKENATTIIEENPKEEVSVENKTGNPLVMLLILLGIIGFCPLKRD
ncbi:MAG: hypothetical protein IJQ68_02190 [Methanobrevibacter sp.]|uniref:hypothetical protein n=1 Tax=Methanobrevibacter sp. TaxID=66852 RepID=UPI0025D4CCFA|nr:hypothetical protein [Methanobrevibacter sp.]MBR0270790.1 hypothetical protein [Methanobrevibacter sp.]